MNIFVILKLPQVRQPVIILLSVTTVSIFCPCLLMQPYNVLFFLVFFCEGDLASFNQHNYFENYQMILCVLLSSLLFIAE